MVGWGGGAALIVAAVVLANMRRATAPVWKALGFIGNASYALYLVHSFTFYAASHAPPVARLIDPAAHTWLYAAMLVGSAVAAAIIVHLFFEKPVTVFLHKKIEKFGLQRTGRLT